MCIRDRLNSTKRRAMLAQCSARLPLCIVLEHGLAASRTTILRAIFTCSPVSNNIHQPCPVAYIFTLCYNLTSAAKKVYFVFVLQYKAWVQTVIQLTRSMPFLRQCKVAQKRHGSSVTVFARCHTLHPNV